MEVAEFASSGVGGAQIGDRGTDFVETGGISSRRGSLDFDDGLGSGCLRDAVLR
jgi:hypothetical protein